MLSHFERLLYKFPVTKQQQKDMKFLVIFEGNLRGYVSAKTSNQNAIIMLNLKNQKNQGAGIIYYKRL